MMPRLFFAIALCCGMTACEPPATAVSESAYGTAASDLDAVRDWAAGSLPRPATDAANASKPLPSVDSMLSGLEERLATAPNDLKGWTLLATSYAYVGRLDDARRAQKTAVALGADAKTLEQQILAAHTGATR